jgi:hypothetical protein
VGVKSKNIFYVYEKVEKETIMNKIEPLKIMFAYRQPELAIKINEIIERLNEIIGNQGSGEMENDILTEEAKKAVQMMEYKNET